MREKERKAMWARIQDQRTTQVNKFNDYRKTTRQNQLKNNPYGRYMKEEWSVDDRKKQIFGQSARLDFTISEMEKNKHNTWGYLPKRVHMNRYNLGNEFAEEYKEVRPVEIKGNRFEVGDYTVTNEDILDEVARNAKKRGLLDYTRNGGRELIRKGVFEASHLGSNPFTVKIGTGTYVIAPMVVE